VIRLDRSHSELDTVSLIYFKIAQKVCWRSDCRKRGVLKKVRWGILSTANIGIKKVVPAMQKGQHVDVIAIASRDRSTAEQAFSQQRQERPE